MRSFLMGIYTAFTLCAGSAAMAGTITATPATLASIFKTAKAGDTIVLVGNFGRTALSNRSFATPLRLDARRAIFSDSLIITNMTGLTITGGTYGSTTGPTSAAKGISVYTSKNLSISGAKFVGDGTGLGIQIATSDTVKIATSTFTGLKVGAALTSVTNGSLTGNKVYASTSDGFNVSGSHGVTVSGNSCSAGAPGPGAHPDCVQLWSIKGTPVQSDITVSGNTATGYTQGFTSFTPDNGGGLRIKIINNRVNTSMPQGIACYGCVDSTITGNILTTLAGSTSMTNINVVGGSNNIVLGNSIGPRSPNGAAAMTQFAASTAAQAFATSVDPDLASGRRGFTTLADSGATLNVGRDKMLAMVDAQSTVPEPASWLMMITGFAFAGSIMRVRRRATA